MKTSRWRTLAAVTAFLAFAMTACSSGGVAQEDYDKSQSDLAAAQADLATAQQQIADLESQMSSSGPEIVVQTSTSDPSVPAAPSGWDTPASQKLGVQLLATYDTSGEPDAWDPAAHPHVFVTSEGHGYAGFISEVFTLAGLQLIDADTHENFASASFDLGFEQTGTPHGLGVSMDGKYIYIPTSDGSNAFRPSTPTGGRLLVVDARTLKLHQVIGTGYQGPHHVKAFIDYAGNSRIIVERQGGATLLLDPNDDNRVVDEFGPDLLFGQNYQVDAAPGGQYLYFDLSSGGRGNAPYNPGMVAKVDLETRSVTYINGVGNYPNGFAFTADGKYTFVADSVTSTVFKIDNATNQVVASAQSGVPGPYEIALNEDETELYMIGKGEMTYNLGGSLGLIDTRTFRTVRDYDIGGQTIDHDIMNPWHPTEMWVTSSGTAEVIVFDMSTKTVATRIADANGGDTHSGSFVEYNTDFSGSVINDMTGPKGWFFDQVAAAAAAAMAG
jgi:DNA-binding beta-propeller fold protein YncE